MVGVGGFYFSMAMKEDGGVARTEHAGRTVLPFPSLPVQHLIGTCMVPKADGMHKGAVAQGRNTVRGVLGRNPYLRFIEGGVSEKVVK